MEQLENLRYEVLVEREDTREIMSPEAALFKNAKAVRVFLEALADDIGIDKDGNGKDGETYMIFVTEYNTRTGRYSFSGLRQPILLKSESYSLDRIEKTLNHFKTPHVYETEDVTYLTADFSKKRAQMIEKITLSHFRNAFIDGEFYDVYFKNGETAHCSYKKDIMAACDRYGDKEAV